MVRSRYWPNSRHSTHSLISSVQNWLMQLMSEIQIACNDHCIPEPHQFHIPRLSTISLGSNHPDLPSILQVLVSTFRPLYMLFPLCLDQNSLSLLMPSFLPYRPQLKCHLWHAFTLTIPCEGKISLLFSSEPPISFFGSIYHNLLLSMFTYLSHPEGPCPSWSHSNT